MKDYFDKDTECDSIDSNDDVVIVNPTKYMIDPS
jgi:hypothetical protein